jgi:hypothetical protein
MFVKIVKISSGDDMPQFAAILAATRQPLGRCDSRVINASGIVSLI